MYGAFSRKLTTKKSKDLHHPLNIEEMNIFTPNILILKILMSEDIWILVTLWSGNTSNSSHNVPVLLNRPVHTSLESNLSSWTMFWGRNANIGPTLITCDQNSKWQSYFKTKKKDPQQVVKENKVEGGLQQQRGRQWLRPWRTRLRRPLLLKPACSTASLPHHTNAAL